MNTLSGNTIIKARDALKLAERLARETQSISPEDHVEIARAYYSLDAAISNLVPSIEVTP